MTSQLIGVLCLAMMCAGCVPAGECDEMERFTQLVAESASTLYGTSASVPLLTIPNRDGLQAIALGSLDTVGAVRLVPRTPQFTAQVPLVVSARAPYIGTIPAGIPIDVFSYITAGATLGSYSVVAAQLDIVTYPCEPNLEQKRAVQVYNEAVLLNGSGAGNSKAVKVTGRSRVRVMWSTDNFLAQSVTGRIDAYAIGGLGTTAIPIFGVGADNGSATATGGIVEFSIAGMHNGSPHILPGASVIDYVVVSFTSGTAADTAEVNVQAWD